MQSASIEQRWRAKVCKSAAHLHPVARRVYGVDARFLALAVEVLPSRLLHQRLDHLQPHASNKYNLITILLKLYEAHTNRALDGHPGHRVCKSSLWTPGAIQSVQLCARVDAVRPQVRPVVVACGRLHLASHF